MGSQSLEMTEWLSSFTLLFHFHQKALCSSSLSAIRVVPSAYLRLLIFLPAILIPAVLHPVKVKEENEKASLKVSIQKIKIMTSGPITSWQIDGEAMETVTDFNLGGSKITADGDCSHEIKRHLLLGRKAMTNLESILKSRDNTLLTNVYLVKAMVFPVMYGCESWTIKKAEHGRIDAFELWCWRRLLRVPWTERRSNQSILKKINPEYSLRGLMLKLKLQYFGHLMWRADSFEKTLRCWERLKAGGEEDNTGWDGWMASPTQWIWVWASSESWWWTGKPGVLWSMGLQRVGHDWATKQQQDNSLGSINSKHIHFNMLTI